RSANALVRFARLVKQHIARAEGVDHPAPDEKVERDVLFDQPREAYKGIRGPCQEYAELQARSIRDNLHADWGLAESGSVGGSTHPGGAPAGLSVVAIAGPDGFLAHTILETESDDRIANMYAFTRNALNFLEKAVC
ncbi:MAG: CinA family protein, partial [Pseudomonadota bacterium]